LPRRRGPGYASRTSPVDHGPRRPLWACLHLPPGPGCIGHLGVQPSVERLHDDLEVVLGAGFDGVVLENDADKPHGLVVTKAQVAFLARLALEARGAWRGPLGIGVQRIDWEASLAIASAVGLEMVRLDTFVDRVRMGGELVEVVPSEVRALRRALGAERVELWTDVHVKHADLVEPSTLIERSASRAVEEGAAAVLVTGRRTGEPPDPDDLVRVRAAVGGRVPVVVASGLAPDNAARLAPLCDAAVVGTALMTEGRIDPARTRRLVEAWRG